MLRKTGLVVLERQGRFRLYRTEPACLLGVAGHIKRLAAPQEPLPLAGEPGERAPSRRRA